MQKLMSARSRGAPPADLVIETSRTDGWSASQAEAGSDVHYVGVSPSSGSRAPPTTANDAFSSRSAVARSSAG